MKPHHRSPGPRRPGTASALLRARSTDSATPIRATLVFSGRADKAVHAQRWRGQDALERCRRPRSRCASSREPRPSKRTSSISGRLRSSPRHPCPIDPALSGALREAFLLQRYGGPAVDVDAIPGRGGTRQPGTAAPSSDYAVQAWADARRAFHVVDQWRAALDAAKPNRCCWIVSAWMATNSGRFTPGGGARRLPRRSRTWLAH
jgi:hypothetical protein